MELNKFVDFTLKRLFKQLFQQTDMQMLIMANWNLAVVFVYYQPQHYLKALSNDSIELTLANSRHMLLPCSHAPVWFELALTAHARAVIPAGRRQHQQPVHTYRSGPPSPRQYRAGAPRPQG